MQQRIHFETHLFAPAYRNAFHRTQYDDAADREYNMWILGRGWNEAIDLGDGAYRTRFWGCSGSRSSEEEGGRNGGEEEGEEEDVVERVPEGPTRNWWWR